MINIMDEKSLDIADKKIQQLKTIIPEAINEKIIKTVLNQKPKKVITLDRLFNNNDQLKTNTALQMKDAGIEFKVI